jgi:hypothetical protein
MFRRRARRTLKVIDQTHVRDLHAHYLSEGEALAEAALSDWRFPR